MASQMKIDPPVPPKAYCGEEVKFSTETPMGVNGSLITTVTGPERDAPIKPQQVGRDFNYSVVFPVPGDYQVSITFNGEHVPGSPFPLRVDEPPAPEPEPAPEPAATEPEPEPEPAPAADPGPWVPKLDEPLPVTGKVNDVIDATITVPDDQGEVKGIQVWATGGSALPKIDKGPNGRTWWFKITYPAVPDTYKVGVLYDGKHVVDSPWQVTITE